LIVEIQDEYLRTGGAVAAPSRASLSNVYVFTELCGAWLGSEKAHLCRMSCANKTETF